MNKAVKLIECPRDAMQGWRSFIPTQKKIEYINSLLRVGFDTIDFGSFVSPKAIPQMADTAEVVRSLDPIAIGSAVGSTKLLAIVANMRGAEEASVFEQISYLGFPFSISETFQQRNTNCNVMNGASISPFRPISNYLPVMAAIHRRWPKRPMGNGSIYSGPKAIILKQKSW